MLLGTLYLKINKVDSSKLYLNEAYSKLKILQKNFSIDCNIAILTNHLQGEYESINMLDSIKDIYKSDYESKTINNLKHLIENESSKDVLFKIFDIND